MSSTPQIKRISITIDKNLLENLDKFVSLHQTVSEDTSRSSVIRDLVKKYIPTDTPQ